MITFYLGFTIFVYASAGLSSIYIILSEEQNTKKSTLNKSDQNRLINKVDLSALGFKQNKPRMSLKLMMIKQIAKPNALSANDERLHQMTCTTHVKDLPMTLIIKHKNNRYFLGHDLYHLAQDFNLILNEDRHLVKYEQNDPTKPALYKIMPDMNQAFNPKIIYQKNYHAFTTATISQNPEQQRLAIAELSELAKYFIEHLDAQLLDEHSQTINHVTMSNWFSKLQNTCI